MESFSGPDATTSDDGPPPPSPRARSAEARRDAILTAAATAFVEHGYGATSVDDIAERLGVSKPTLYYHVGGKQELLGASFTLALDAYSDAVEDEAVSGVTGRERLHQVVQKYVEITTTVHGRCLHRVPDVELTPEVRDRLRAVKRKVDARIRDLLREGVRDGSLRSADIRMSTFAISGAMNSIAQWYAPSGKLSPEEIAERLWDSFAEGLRPR
ncbi:MAG: TetR/AcrR family transcriptional regulator [Brevundimonas sp.]|uniref:TetR/AcrR family transcriptional regulator n=1 Tax=Brevundimonas sp. TaxID=1871086 RepID=UPI0040335A3E